MLEYSAREQRGWYVYDWANSAFYTTVVTLFLGPYLTSLAKNAADRFDTAGRFLFRPPRPSAPISVGKDDSDVLAERAARNRRGKRGGGHQCRRLPNWTAA